jgi:hypothetical protein
MEILNVIPGSTGNMGWGVFIVIIALTFLIVSVWAAIDGEGEIFATFLAIAVGAGFLSIFAYTDSSPEQYEVKITDFNEVYSQGYEIIEQRGEIYVVKKAEAK